MNDRRLFVRNLDKRHVADIGKPQLISFFSLTSEREYEGSAKQLKYFKEPSSQMYPLDLNIGLGTAIEKPKRDEKIDHLLKFLLDHFNEFLKVSEQTMTPVLQADFICYRGRLKTIMCSPYEYRSDWSILATQFNNTIYLCKRDTEQELFEKSHRTEFHIKATHWGYKFEQYCVVDSPQSEPKTDIKVDECAEFNGVFKAKFDGLDLLYSAEVDGIISDLPVDLDANPHLLENLKFIELKTCSDQIILKKSKPSWAYRTRNWWCQSFLAGISEIIIGIRNEKGFVNKLEHFEVDTLPEPSMAKDVCINFLIKFLKYVREIVGSTNDPDTTFEFYFNPKGGVITCQRRYGKTDYTFLPDWYTRRFKEMKSQHHSN